MLKKYGITLLLLLVVSSTLAADDQRKNTLTVQGNALLRLPSSELQLSLSTLSSASTAQEALEINQEKMEKLLGALKSVGIKPEEIETGSFDVSPTYTRPPKDHDENWRPQINGYQIRNTLSVRTNQLNLAGKMIDAAVAGGADQIDSLHFLNSHQEEAQNQALSLAIQNALTQAQIAASAANVKIKGIREIIVNPSDHVMPTPRFGLFKASAMETHIAPGTVEVRANVSVVYEIKD